jgi:hypothetical protein
MPECQAAGRPSCDVSVGSPPSSGIHWPIGVLRQTAEQIVELLTMSGYQVDLAVDGNDRIDPRKICRVCRYDNRSFASGYRWTRGYPTP